MHVGSKKSEKNALWRAAKVARDRRQTDIKLAQVEARAKACAYWFKAINSQLGQNQHVWLTIPTIMRVGL